MAGQAGEAASEGSQRPLDGQVLEGKSLIRAGRRRCATFAVPASAIKTMRPSTVGTASSAAGA